MFLKIIWALDAVVMVVLAINFLNAGGQISSSFLLLIFAALILMSYNLRIKRPKLAIMVAALPVLTPILMYAFLAFIFIIAPVFN